MANVEPPPTAWGFPPPDSADEDGLVGVGADLHPGTVLAAYRSGLFPMPLGRRGPMGWWSPNPRGVLPLDGMVVSRSLRRSCQRYVVQVDTAFEQVVANCADPARPHGWITPEIEAAYQQLHELGWAHSIETWTTDGRLVGGLYGIAIGGLFAGESMFHHSRDASKVALVHLVELLGDDLGPRRLLDVQWSTPHLASLGVVERPRSHYLERLAEAITLPLPAVFAEPAC